MNAKKYPSLIFVTLLVTALAACLPAAASAAYHPGPTPAAASTGGVPYPIVDTGQAKCYDNEKEIPCSAAANAGFTGQDAQYASSGPSYRDNGDGTVTDLVTGLTWMQDPGEKVTYQQALSGAEALTLGGYSDWRLPSIKELYSLIRFDGTDVSRCMSGGACSAAPFIDTRYFAFEYGDQATGDRIIDSQYWSSTEYVSTTMNGNATAFGVNFADGRIKGYPSGNGPNGALKTEYALYVRGNPEYGRNDFSDNGDGTISDRATGLTWTQADSGRGMDWSGALGYCENLTLAGQSDWRLPDAKELHSIVDYSRSPATSATPALDPLFLTTKITNEAGQTDYPFYWSSTTHADLSKNATFAVYIAFGSAPGYMNGSWMDVHGAGAQRSDPKSGSASDYPVGHGPQGDAIRVDNFARCVRGGTAAFTAAGRSVDARPTITISAADNPAQDSRPGQPGSNGGQPSSPAGGPPPVAVEACGGLPAGAVCRFGAPFGSVSGTCQQKQQFVCVPSEQP